MMHVVEHKLVAGDLEAVFLPGRGMLGTSLKHRGEELLRRLEDIESAALKGSTAGIPLLYPWANRLAMPRFRAVNRDITLDPSSSLLHLDGQGLLIHGVRWSHLAWEVITAKSDRHLSLLDWNRPELLEVFPFRHQVEMTITLNPDSLTIDTAVIANDPVPVSFGFHPYLGIPGLPRSEWQLELPAMRRLVLDEKGIPDGKEQSFEFAGGPLGDLEMDAGFVVLDKCPRFSLAGAGRRITMVFLEGYQYAQIYAPKRKDYIALEPMTAPTSALTTGQGLKVVAPGEEFQASFRISVESFTDPSVDCPGDCLRE